MSHSVSFGRVAKRKNSTLQGGTSAAYNVLFKNPTSLDRPTFTLNASDFDYNYAKMGNRYYFVEDIVYRNNDIVEVSCVLDPLATYKSEILASTQYVTYSSVSGGVWLPDTRIPILKSTRVARASATPSFISKSGCYILSVVGKNSAASYRLPTDAQIKMILAEVNNWMTTGVQEIEDLIDGTTPEDAIASLARVVVNSDFVGNAYAQAPSCIRSCIWVPFDYAGAPSAGSDTIYLGNFNTELNELRVASTPRSSTTTVSIPWHYNDWRRGHCEDVYLYLPLVGTVNISASSITQASSLSVKWSVTYTDGVVCYEVLAGNEIIGTYGGNCATNYPIGINQQASAGEILNSVIGGVEKTFNAAISSSISPISAGAAAGAVAFEGVAARYNTIDTIMTTHATCIGGVGGGAGAGLDLNIVCYTVAHDTAVEPSVMAATMGLPTMKPLTLSSCSGFCQCANAHVAVPAEGWVMNAIDSYLNSGFYIE